MATHDGSVKLLRKSTVGEAAGTAADGRRKANARVNIQPSVESQRTVTAGSRILKAHGAIDWCQQALERYVFHLPTCITVY